MKRFCLFLIVLFWGWLVTFNTNAQTTFSNATNISIPGSGNGSPYPSTIAVSGMDNCVTEIQVRIPNISHTYYDDIDIMLSGPGNTVRIFLMSDCNGDNSGTGNRNFLFRQSGGALSDGSLNASGTYRPTDFQTGESLPTIGAATTTTLASFNGINPNGTWSLWVRDDASGDAGSLIGGWSIIVTTITASVAPTAASAATNPACVGTSVNLTASGGTLGTGGVVQWYTGGCGTTLVGTGNPLAITVPGSATTYYARYSGTCNTTGCASFTLNVNTNSTAPGSITGTTTICSGGTTTLTQSGGSLGTGAVYNWYTGGCGTTLYGTGNSISSVPVGTYYVRAQGTCNTTTCASTTVSADLTAPTAPTAFSTTWVGDHFVNTSFTTNNPGGSADGGTGMQGYRLGRSNNNSSAFAAWVGGITNAAVTVSGADLPANGAYRYYYWYAFDNCNNQSAASGTYIRMDNVAPSRDNVTVTGSTCWNPNNVNNYTITLTSTEAQDGTQSNWGGSYGMMALVNYQGSLGCSCDGANVGGYFAWHPSSYVHGADQTAATSGGGFCSKSIAYGGSKVSLVSCNTSLSGNQRTVNFVVRPNQNYPAFTNNDVSMYTSDAVGNNSGWTNFDLNFNTDIATSYSVDYSSSASAQSVTIPPSSGTGSIGHVAGASFGFTSAVSGGAWPVCVNWGLPTSLKIIDANHTGACAIPLANADAILTFNPTHASSNLPGGNLCYTGTTDFVGAANCNVRLRLQIRYTTGGAAVPIQRTGSGYLMVRANQNITVRAWIEVQAPASGLSYYSTTGIGGANIVANTSWHALLPFFDNILNKASSNNICTSFYYDWVGGGGTGVPYGGGFFKLSGIVPTSSASPNPYCLTAPTQLNALALTGGIGTAVSACSISHEWRTSTTTPASFSGSQISTTQSPTALTNPPGSTTYNYMLSGPANICYGTSAITVTQNSGNPTTWSGTTSTDWFTHSNWDRCVPDITKDAIIPVQTNICTIPTATSGNAKSVTIQGNAPAWNIQGSGTVNVAD